MSSQIAQDFEAMFANEADKLCARWPELAPRVLARIKQCKKKKEMISTIVAWEPVQANAATSGMSKPLFINIKTAKFNN